MTTAIWGALDTVDVEHISERARKVSFRKSVLRLIAGFFFLIGWLIAKMFTVAWFAAVWVVVATAEGWNVARKDAQKARARE